MEKVKVTSEQAKRIKYYKEYWGGKGFRTFIEYALAGWGSPINECLNELTPEQQASTWINDYEVVLTPHERILEYYKDEGASKDYIACKQRAIAITLNILGITIEGIND